MGGRSGGARARRLAGRSTSPWAAGGTRSSWQEHGFRVFGVDVKLDAVRDAVAQASTRGLVVRGWCADLTRFPLPRERFELVVVTRYLQRDLFPSLERRPDTRRRGVV